MLNHRPLYRVVVREALTTAWRLRRFWPFAILAAMLQTGGVLDMVLITYREFTAKSPVLFSGAWVNSFSASHVARGFHSLSEILGTLGLVQAAVLSSLLVGVFLACSVVAQGALVFGINGTIRGRIPSFRECLTIGARFFPRVAILNILTLGLLWIVRFGLLLALAATIQHHTYLNMVLAFVASLVFIATAITLTAMHVFCINALIFDDLSLAKSIEDALVIVRKGWLVLLETSILMLAVGFGILLVTSLVFAIASIPLWMLMVSSFFISASTPFFLVTALQAVLLVCVLFVSAAFTVTFQYDTWSQLFTHIDEHGAQSKLHRLYYWIAGTR